VQFVAPVGTDFPAAHLDLLQQSGWDLDGMPRRSIPSIRNWVVYEYDGRRTWILRSDPGDFFELSPRLDDIPSGYRHPKAYVLLAMDLAAQENLAPRLKQSGAIVALDPQEDYIAGNHARIFKLLKSVDIFMPSEEEVYRLLGRRDPLKAAQEFAAYGCRMVVVKLGGDGSLIYDAGTRQSWHIPVYATHVVDTTGAGDSYIGGFMAAYVQSGDPVQAGLAGSVSASFAIEAFGLSHMFVVDAAAARQRLERLAAVYSEVKAR
jgi:sugar/nucleoside kinase (ribokinase family)